jgi:hypothetical protein
VGSEVVEEEEVSVGAGALLELTGVDAPTAEPEVKQRKIRKDYIQMTPNRKAKPTKNTINLIFLALSIFCEIFFLEFIFRLRPFDGWGIGRRANGAWFDSTARVLKKGEESKREEEKKKYNGTKNKQTRAGGGEEKGNLADKGASFFCSEEGT